MTIDWKRPGWAAVFVFCAALVSGGLLLMHRLETGGDNLDFLLMARSIQTGAWADLLGWYRAAGYSIFVAAVLTLFGVRLEAALFAPPAEAIYLLKAIGVLLHALTSVAVFSWARLVLGNWKWAGGLALLYAINQHVASMASVIGAETLLLLTMFLALYFWERYALPSENRSRLALILFVLFAGLSMFIKYQGMVVGVAFGIWILWRRIYRLEVWLAGLFLFSCFLLAIGLMLRGNSFGLTHMVDSTPYGMGQRITWLFRLQQASRVYTLSWADLLVPKVAGAHGVLEIVRLHALIWPFSALVAAMLVTGFFSSAGRGMRPSHFVLMTYYVMLFAWPDFLVRYLLPILPLGLWMLWEGVQAMVRLGGARFGFWRPGAVGARRALLGGVALLVLWGTATNAFAGIKNWRNIVRLRARPAWAPERYRISREDDFAEFIEGCQWVRDHAEPEAVVFCRKALFGELAAARPCVYYTSSKTPDELWQALVASAGRAPTYLLRDTFGANSTYGRAREYLVTPVLRDHAGELEVVHRFSSGLEVYRVASR